MSATKHTKGEWKKVRKPYGWDIEGDGVWIGSIHNDHSSENERSPQGFPGNAEGEANADLVISASTLQAKIEELEAWKNGMEELLREVCHDNQQFTAKINQLEAEKAELVEILRRLDAWVQSRPTELEFMGGEDIIENIQALLAKHEPTNKEKEG